MTDCFGSRGALVQLQLPRQIGLSVRQMCSPVQSKRVMDTYRFQVVIEQDEDGLYVADVPAPTGCHSQGRTFEEALENVREVITMCVSVNCGRMERLSNRGIQR